MPTCDNCGSEANTRVKHERVETRWQLSWPPIERVIVQEWWCRRCHYAPLNSAVSPSKRRRYDIEAPE